MNRIRLALFEKPTQAEPFRQRLQQAGVRAEIHAESGVARLWFVSRWRAGARLEVPVNEAERAADLLHQWDGCDSSLEHAIRCPECKSFRVDYPQFTEKSLFTNLTMGLIAELGFIERQYYCENCHYMWTRPGTRSARSRPHLAPDYFLEDTANERHAGRVAEPGGAVGRRFAPVRLKTRPARCGAAARWNRMRLRMQMVGVAIPVAGSLLILEAGGGLSASELDPHSFAVRPGSRPPAAVKSPTYLGDVLPILMGKCARCHNDQSAVLANWLDYKTAARKRWEIKRRVWDSYHGTYFKQPMPTANGPEAAAITDEERQIIKDWVVGGVPRGVAPVYTGGISKSARIEMGKRLFGTVCAACHQPTGQGIPGRFPPLAGSDFLNADKRRAIKIVVNGLQGELVVNGQRFNNAMPRFPLTDDDISSALTFVYNSFGNSGKEVTPEEVSAARNEKDEPGATAISTAKAPEEKSPYE